MLLFHANAAYRLNLLALPSWFTGRWISEHLWTIMSIWWISCVIENIVEINCSVVFEVRKVLHFFRWSLCALGDCSLAPNLLVAHFGCKSSLIRNRGIGDLQQHMSCPVQIFCIESLMHKPFFSSLGPYMFLWIQGRSFHVGVIFLFWNDLMLAIDMIFIFPVDCCSCGSLGKG